MRIVFAGTPSAAVPPLEKVAGSDDVVLVVTRVDAPVGRKKVLTPSPVAEAAERLGIPIHKANRFDDATVDALRRAAPDLGVVVAFGAIIPDAVLDIPRLGWVNLHFSLLPQWRGAAPTQRSIAAGDQPGFSIVRVVSALDAGPVFRQRAVDLGADITGSEALDALARAGAIDLADVIRSLGEGSAGEPTPQAGEPSYARKLTRDDGRIDWSRPVLEVYARVRAMTNEPGAWTLDGDEPVKVLSAGPAAQISFLESDKDGDPGRVAIDDGQVFVQCRDGFLPIGRVQPAGKKSMDAMAWMRGHRDDRVVLR